MMIHGYPDKTVSALEYLGFVQHRDFQAYSQRDASISIDWISVTPVPTVAEITAAILPAVKSIRIASINAECRARLLSRYGTAEEQVSRSLGIYGSAEQAAMQLGIAATIDASNTASNAVINAADIAAVEAVTVTWPVI